MKGSRLLIWGMALCVAVAFAGAIGVILTVFDHNEHMYLAAGVQVAQNKVIYRDFAYLQMPYLPLLYGKLLQWLPIQAYYLLAGKVVSCFFLGLSAATLFLIGRRVLGQLAPALGIVALFLLNMTIIGPAAEVSNYIAPLALSLLSFYAFLVSTDQARVKSLGLALSGFCLALAIGSKLTYTPTVVPFLIALGRLPVENGTPAAAQIPAHTRPGAVHGRPCARLAAVGGLPFRLGSVSLQQPGLPCAQHTVAPADGLCRSHVGCGQAGLRPPDSDTHR